MAVAQTGGGERNWASRRTAFTSSRTSPSDRPRAQLPEAEDENMVLFFGRIWPYKGLEHLIRAEPLVTAAVPERENRHRRRRRAFRRAIGE